VGYVVNRVALGPIVTITILDRQIHEEEDDYEIKQ
jgi:hypothetical protein